MKCNRHINPGSNAELFYNSLDRYMYVLQEVNNMTTTTFTKAQIWLGYKLEKRHKNSTAHYSTNKV